ncbi:MAG: DUF2563 family protein [Mycobacterium sp.]
MAGQSLFVSPEGLDAGAGRCEDAATSAASGAEVLQGVSIESRIFGDFDAAHGFHVVAAQVHEHHVQKFTGHQDGLSGLSGKGQDAAKAFTDADDTSGESIDRQMPG